MVYFIDLFVLCLIFGVLGVAAQPSPFYGTIGMILGAVGGCGVLVLLGGSFVGLVLFLIYLGGMLVVFAYSAALAAESYPETWLDYPVFVYVVGYVLGMMILGGWVVEVKWCGGQGLLGLDSLGFNSLRGDFSGVALFYLQGGWMLLLCGWGLLLVLFVVLELVRGRSWGGVRLP
uniref:NADH-ubiquinone oxidoreductase chain 6 n=1 Tax=Pachydactylus punctatus TaxID=185352 RepID=A0A7R7G1W2_9SAUR|nr:NADH dehydrogenase subunit 6 [Pachydactylus punctatus]